MLLSYLSTEEFCELRGHAKNNPDELIIQLNKITFDKAADVTKDSKETVEKLTKDISFYISLGAKRLANSFHTQDIPVKILT